LNDDYTSSLKAVGDRIYYNNLDDGGNIYTMKTDGSGRRKLNDDKSSFLNVVGNRIYYYNLDDNK
jgi:hypothetical protein